MRRALASLLAAACAAPLAVTAANAASSINVGDNYFVRKSGVPTVSVARNARVTWRWVGDSAHNVVVTRGPVKFRSRTQTNGTYSRKMTRRGTYRIVCELHGPSDQSMVLKVR